MWVGIFVARFSNYNATYGSLGAVVVLLTWLYLSSYVLLLGAELNAELEREAADLGDKPSAEQERPAASSEGRGAGSPPSGPARPLTPAQAQPSAAGDYLAARFTARMGRSAGLRHVGIVASCLATAGLALIRGRDRARVGVLLVGVAAGLAWWSGQRIERVDADFPDGTDAGSPPRR